MIDHRSESFKKQALGYTRAFFILLERAFGFKFEEEKKREIVQFAYRDTANHVNKHRIFQRTIDGLKLTSFLAYHTAHKVVKTTSHGAVHDPAREASKAGIDRLNALLKLETSSEIDLSNGDKTYLVSMLYAEVTDNCDVGIGANGLSTTFTFLQRIRPCKDRLSNI